MKTQGIVSATSAKPRETRWGTKNVYAVQVDGTWYDFGFKNPSINKGDNVSLEYEETQYGKKVKSHDVTQGSPAAPLSQGLSKFRDTVNNETRQRSIVRQTCLKVSGETVAALVQAKLLKTEDVVDTLLLFAKGLEPWAMVEEPEDDPNFDELRRAEALANLVSEVEEDC